MVNRKLRAKILESLQSLPDDYQSGFNRLYCQNNDVTVPIEDTVKFIDRKYLESALENVSRLSKQFALSVLDK